MTGKALIIFDVDGTLFQTAKVTVPAVQRTLAAQGLPEPDAASVCAHIGRPVEEYLEWLASLCPPGRAAEIVDAANRLELDLIGAEGELFPGMREALDELQAEGHVLAICSNGPDDYVNEFLDAHDMRRYLTIVRIRGTRYSGKEAMIREILERVSLRPAIVVGDRDDDVSAAHANGALVIAVSYGFGSAEELAGADGTIHAAAEIPETVRRLMDREGG